MRKPVKGLVLRPPVAIAGRYSDRLTKLVRRMTDDCEKQIRALFTSPVAIESHVTTDASISSQARILANALTSKFQIMFNQSSGILANGLVASVGKQSALDLGRSLKELGDEAKIPTKILQTGTVADIAKASVAENVGLIKSIPAQYLEKVQGAVMRSIQTGNGLQDLVPFLEKQKSITLRRASMIAFDQTRKVYNGLNAGRMRAANQNNYEWIHSGGGQKPREEHVDMDGNIYSLDDPPEIDSRTGERGIPGQLPNCRCTMRPVISFGEAE